jgi:hypothetical protein
MTSKSRDGTDCYTLRASRSGGVKLSSAAWPRGQIPLGKQKKLSRLFFKFFFVRPQATLQGLSQLRFMGFDCCVCCSYNLRLNRRITAYFFILEKPFSDARPVP